MCDCCGTSDHAHILVPTETRHTYIHILLLCWATLHVDLTPHAHTDLPHCTLAPLVCTSPIRLRPLPTPHCTPVWPSHCTHAYWAVTAAHSCTLRVQGYRFFEHSDTRRVAFGLGRNPVLTAFCVCGYTGESIARVGVHRLWTRLAVNGCLWGADVWSGDLWQLGDVGGPFVGRDLRGHGWTLVTQMR